MQYKFFTVPVMSGDTAQVESELNAFLRGNRVLSVQRELVCNGPQSYWCCCVEYTEGHSSHDATTSSSLSRPEKREKVDYRKLLSEEEFKRFYIMRSARKQIAEHDAIPAYAIMLDEQLAELAKLPEIDEKALKSMNGFGEKKFEKFGKRILELLKEMKNETVGQSV